MREKEPQPDTQQGRQLDKMWAAPNMDSHAAKLDATAENALFLMPPTEEWNDSYLESLDLVEGGDLSERNVCHPYNSYSTAAHASLYDYDFSCRSDGIGQETGLYRRNESIDSSYVSDIDFGYTPYFSSPELVIPGHDLDSRSWPTVWECPSVTSDTNYSVSPAPIPRTFNCDWPKCSDLEFNTAEEHKKHNKFHAREVRTSWQPCSKCTWHNCSSQAKLKTSKSFEDHITNIHINPLLCTQAGCTHKTPFRGKADLQRHIDSVHRNTLKIRCPYLSCQASNEKSYSRKDKLLNHLRKAHNTESCPYQHCESCMFSSPEDCEGMAKHIGKMHGEYECALKSCFDTRSHFSEEGFMAHLQLHHNFEWESVLKTRDIAKREGRILRDQHVEGQFEFKDCTSCIKRSRSSCVYV